MNTLKRPLLRYLGGKYLLSSWIISHFPSHYIYCEPFGGGGSVLCQKNPSPIEVYNDLDSQVVNFFQILREAPAELIRQIELTPYSREEYKLSFEPSDDPIESARRLYVRSWQARGAGYTAKGSSGWRHQNRQWSGNDVVRAWNRTDDLWDFVRRLKKIQIENEPALDVIERYDSESTLFYLDPPYLHQTRAKSHRKEYFCEMADEEHIELATTLHNIQGMAIVSGYDSPLYQEIFRGWGKAAKTVQTNGKTEAVETLWISPQCQVSQLSLWAIASSEEVSP